MLSQRTVLYKQLFSNLPYTVALHLENATPLSRKKLFVAYQQLSRSGRYWLVTKENTLTHHNISYFISGNQKTHRPNIPIPVPVLHTRLTVCKHVYLTL
jgi:hypothetical protein